MKIKYNSPVILTFSLLCIIAFAIEASMPGLASAFMLTPDFSFLSPLSYFRLFSYTIGHASMAHLVSNLSIILLIGPAVEEKYGTGRLVFMMIVTAIVTAALQILLFHEGLLGASGIAFMLIILGSLTNFRSGEIPLTFILIAFIFMGNEVVSSFKPDNISQFAHIAGGTAGAFFGLQFVKK